MKKALRQIIVLALGDFLEAADGVASFTYLPGSGEGLGHVEGLGEEALDAAGAGHGQLVDVGELVHAQDGDDVLEVLYFWRMDWTLRAVW